ncbi:MAG: hypothetical protein QOI95_33 [Acidimicrobiaceae bacterium]|jgi:hypothetical protein
MDLLHAALEKVGKSAEELRALLGSLLDDGSAYLVGSLAASYGNRCSDIDIHIFDDGGEGRGAPMMYFLDQTIVDVVQFDRMEVDQLVASLPSDWVPLGGGHCALGPAKSRKAQIRLGRWSTAIPLDDLPPLMPVETKDAVVAANARGALEEMICTAAIAHLIDARSDASAVRGGAWRRAASSMLELVVRSRGEVFVGAKWLWAKAAKVGLPREVIGRIDSVRVSDEFRRAAAELRVPDLDPFALVHVKANPSVEEFELNHRGFMLVNDQHLLDRDLMTDGTLAEEMDRIGPSAVLTALGIGATTLAVDDTTLDRTLR